MNTFEQPVAVPAKSEVLKFAQNHGLAMLNALIDAERERQARVFRSGLYPSLESATAWRENRVFDPARTAELLRMTCPSADGPMPTPTVKGSTVFPFPGGSFERLCDGSGVKRWVQEKKWCYFNEKNYVQSGIYELVLGVRGSGYESFTRDVSSSQEHDHFIKDKNWQVSTIKKLLGPEWEPAPVALASCAAILRLADSNGGIDPCNGTSCCCTEEAGDGGQVTIQIHKNTEILFFERTNYGMPIQYFLAAAYRKC